VRGKASDERPVRILREGTKIENKLGYFKVAGDRATFFTDDGERRMGGLPNLALERVVRIIEDHPRGARLMFLVSGQVTEFRGQNYLMLSRAVLKHSRREARLPNKP